MRTISRGTGDKGDTSLGDASRVSKDDPRVVVYGTIDELNSFLGLFLTAYKGKEASIVKRVQRELFVLGSDVSTPLDKKQVRIREEHIRRLEQEIETLEDSLPRLKRFILPGGTREAAILHIARTIARRAERSLAPLHRKGEANPHAFVYLNRLSGLLFMLARKVNEELGTKEEEVEPAKS